MPKEETFEEADAQVPSPATVSSHSGRVWEFRIPGHRELGPDKSDRVVRLAEPTEAIVNQCFELAAMFERRSEALHMQVAQALQVRMCLVAVDGVSTTFRQLEGKALWDHIDLYEFTFLVRALDRLTSPPKADVDAFLESAQLVA